MTLAGALILVLLIALLEALLVVAVLLKTIKTLNKKRRAAKTQSIPEPVFCRETGCVLPDDRWSPEPEAEMEAENHLHNWSDLFPEDTYIRTWLGQQGWQILERPRQGEAVWLGSDKVRYPHKRAYEIAQEVEAAQAQGLQKKFPAGKRNRK